MVATAAMAAVVQNVFGENIPGEFIRKHCGEARGRGR